MIHHVFVRATEILVVRGTYELGQKSSSRGSPYTQNWFINAVGIGRKSH
jgi:hypothetical protein